MQYFQEIESAYEGNLHVAAIEITSGKTWMYRADTQVSTASTIKLPILMKAATMVEAGSLKWDDDITLHEEDKVPGMGVLRHMLAPRCVTLHDAAYLMTAVSDNTATNLVLDKTGIEPVNDLINTFGCTHTRLYRKVFHPDTEASRAFGFGVTTAADMMRMMQIIYAPETLRGTFTLPGEHATERIKHMLGLQQDLVGVARAVPPGWTYAGKTGRITSTRGEAAMISAPDGRMWLLGIFMFGLTTPNMTIENEGLLAIAEATRRIILSA
ncbi:MAG: serine hydrolase [Bacteroidetes bacterium]|nr:serine hydrolase [Bacteroidota bacterium]MCH8523291.1 class A beta-lactamase-related serine hydrolase [Balneolales bacterium]